MVDKLIRGKIFEIIIVIIMLGISFPIWQGFDERISKANITTVDDYNLEFDIHNNSKTEEITINNKYYLNKSYNIYLKVNKNIDLKNSYLLINGKSYFLEDFTRITHAGNYIYTIVSNYITARTDKYVIEPHIIGDTVYYAYIFEENTNF